MSLSTNTDQRKNRVPLNGRVVDWLDGVSVWEKTDWGNDAMSVVVGLIDQPAAALQRILTVDLRMGNVAVFGASGWGKTTLLRTLIVALSVTHSPVDLHFYLLDFGMRGLSIFKDLPHVGAFITSEGKDVERMFRLLRMLDTTISTRMAQFSLAHVDHLFAYNQLPDVERLPVIVTVIDNFAELHEEFENAEDMLLPLLRTGSAAGVYFAVSADAPEAIKAKLQNQFKQKLVLRLGDMGKVADLVGRGMPLYGEIQGRGVMRPNSTLSKTPLEFQAAAPVAPLSSAGTLSESGSQQREPQLLNALSQQMNSRLLKLCGNMVTAAEDLRQRQALPRNIGILPDYVHARDWVEAEVEEAPPYAPIGMIDSNLEVGAISLQGNPHFIVVGPPVSGRTTLLRTWIYMLARRYTPHEVNFVLIDPRQRLYSYGDRQNPSQFSFKDLPHTIMTIGRGDEFHTFVRRLKFEYEAIRTNSTDHRPELYVFIDNYDRLNDMVSDMGSEFKELERLAGQHYDKGLHFILCGPPTINSINDGLRRQVSLVGFGFALQTERAVESLGGKVPRALRDVELEVGRGFLVAPGITRLMQVATLQPPTAQGTYTALLDADIDALRQRYSEADHAQWYYDIAPKEVIDAFELPIASTPSVISTSSTPSMRSSAPAQPPTSTKTSPYVALFTPANLILLAQDDAGSALLTRTGIDFSEVPSLKYQVDISVKRALDTGKLKLPERMDDALTDEIKQYLAQSQQPIHKVEGNGS